MLLALKRMLKIHLDFVDLLTVCCNEFVPVVSLFFISLCGQINFLIFLKF